MLAFVLILALVGTASAAEFTLRVDGMACPFCAYGIEKKLLKMPGVEKLNILMDEGKIILTLAAGAELDVPALHSAVRNAGFTLHSILVREAAGRLSRDSTGDLVLTSLDPSITFKVSLKDQGILNSDTQDWPLPVLASGTVTEFKSRTPMLVASKIVPRADLSAQ
jgi:mercuric ion binding protein